MVDAPKAFSDTKYDYYELQIDLGGIVPKGAIFAHDRYDDNVGSPSEGCLKLCWDKNGNCYRGKKIALCGGTVIFHAAFKDSPMFKLVKRSEVAEYEDRIAEIERKRSELDRMIIDLKEQLREKREER